MKVNLSQEWESVKKDRLQPSDVEAANAQLTAHPFLSGMSPHHLRVLATAASTKQFQKGEIIFRAGERANGFYLIESGTVAIEGSVFEHGPVSTDCIHAGEPLGWSWLFPPYSWHYDARAMEPTTTLFFNGEVLHQLCKDDLTLGHELFKRMSQVMVRRLQASRAKLIEALKPGKSGR
jgi:CRP/FNR family transcriptional regulator, cyclic AMP receptor protein